MPQRQEMHLTILGAAENGAIGAGDVQRQHGGPCVVNRKALSGEEIPDSKGIVGTAGYDVSAVRGEA